MIIIVSILVIVYFIIITYFYKIYKLSINDIENRINQLEIRINKYNIKSTLRERENYNELTIRLEKLERKIRGK